MSYHEVKFLPGHPDDPTAPLEQVMTFVDDEGVVHYDGDPGYVAPEPGAFSFLEDFGQQLSTDKERINQGDPTIRGQQADATDAAVAQRLVEPDARRNDGSVPDPVVAPLPEPQVTNQEARQTRNFYRREEQVDSSGEQHDPEAHPVQGEVEDPNQPRTAPAAQNSQ